MLEPHGLVYIQDQVKRISNGITSNRYKRTRSKKIRKFFDTMPHLRHEIEVENPKTKVKNKITFKGIQDFFQ